MYFLLTAGLANKISDWQGLWVENNAMLAKVSQETLENIGNVKTKGAHGFFVARSEKILKKIKAVCVKVGVAEGYITNIIWLIRMMAPVVIIFATILVSPNFYASAGTVMVLFINIPLSLSGFADLHRVYIFYKMSRPFLAKLQEFEDAPLEDEGGVDIAAFESLQTIGLAVTFYGGRVVHVPDFEIKKGEKLMFFGESGIGKSTVFNIVMGLNRDYEGEVLVNGINLREISLASLRMVFGITFQHTNVLTLDLHENILLGVQKTDMELKKLIRLTSLESQEKAKGSDVLSNKVLSGGEKSRIGLAQMLVPKPDIMLIDEAFSNMDEELESKIIKDLFVEYSEHTVICISHRNSSRPFFDRVIDFS